MAWVSPLVNWRAVSMIGSEVTPFVFNGRLYRLENFKRCEDFPGQPVQFRFHEDGFRIRDMADDRIVSVPLLNHYFASAVVWEGRVHVFCGDYGADQPWWEIRRIVHLSSDDLITWSCPELAVAAEGAEHLFNTGACWDGRRFVLLYETDDARWPKFTFKFCVSDDLSRWRPLARALYGVDKYVGGPALYFEGGWYYLLYVHDLGGKWETRITRSRDLITWDDAPADRPFVTFNPERFTNPVSFPGAREINASDVDLCEWEGKTLVYWNGGDQATCGDLQQAEFPGPRRELFERFFA